MPDQLTIRTGRRPTVGTPVLVLAIVAVFAVCGALAGWGWHAWWEAPSGVVADRQWYPVPGESGQRADFDGTAKYVVLALVVGLVGGGAAALALRGQEVAVLVAVVAGSLLGGWLMAVVGSALSPPDPHVLARTAEDGTELTGHLRLPRWSPYTAMPIGALVALVVSYLAVPSRPSPDVGVPHD